MKRVSHQQYSTWNARCFSSAIFNLLHCHSLGSLSNFMEKTHDNCNGFLRCLIGWFLPPHTGIQCPSQFWRPCLSNLCRSSGFHWRPSTTVAKRRTDAGCWKHGVLVCWWVKIVSNDKQVFFKISKQLVQLMGKLAKMFWLATLQIFPTTASWRCTSKSSWKGTKAALNQWWQSFLSLMGHAD